MTDIEDNKIDLEKTQVSAVHDQERLAEDDARAQKSWLYRVWVRTLWLDIHMLMSQTTSWFQIIQVSVAAFCIPGMYNAMSGTGGGGNVDRESLQCLASLQLTLCSAYIAAQSSVAITAVGAASYLTICVPVFEILGVRTMGIGGQFKAVLLHMQ